VVEPAAGDTTGIPIRRKRILEGFHLGATPAGVGGKRIKYRWYRLLAQPPATIVAFLRKAKDRNGRLLQRSL